MTRVICLQLDCLHNRDSRCRAEEIEYDPDDGCLTMEPRLELGAAERAEDEEEDEGWEHRGMRLVDEGE
jgi:hypothetical protein